MLADAGLGGRTRTADPFRVTWGRGQVDGHRDRRSPDLDDDSHGGTPSPPRSRWQPRHRGGGVVARIASPLFALQELLLKMVVFRHSRVPRHRGTLSQGCAAGSTDTTWRQQRKGEGREEEGRRGRAAAGSATVPPEGPETAAPLTGL